MSTPPKVTDPLRHRAGSHIAQPTGYRAFSPAPLPPQPLREDHCARVTQGLGRAAGNGHKVLEHLYQRPIVAVADVEALTATSYTAANNLVSRMVELGVLVEVTGYRRNRLFRYQPYIDLFGEGGVPGQEP